MLDLCWDRVVTIDQRHCFVIHVCRLRRSPNIYRYLGCDNEQFAIMDFGYCWSISKTVVIEGFSAAGMFSSKMQGPVIPTTPSLIKTLLPRAYQVVLSLARYASSFFRNVIGELQSRRRRYLREFIVHITCLKRL